MQDSFVFYKSFYDALMCLPDDEYTKATRFIFDYVFCDVEPPAMQGSTYAIFLMAKPQIDANIKRRIDGSKGAAYGKLGGRPKKNPIGDIVENPIGDMNETPNVNVNENVNVNNIRPIEKRSRNKFNAYPQPKTDWNSIVEEME